MVDDVTLFRSYNDDFATVSLAVVRDGVPGATGPRRRATPEGRPRPRGVRARGPCRREGRPASAPRPTTSGGGKDFGGSVGTRFPGTARESVVSIR
jgi:hypothetical protein